MMAAPVTLSTRSATILAALALAACQPQDPNGKPAPPPADAPQAPAPPSGSMDISRPITARGTEPFWALAIDGTKFTLTRPDRPELLAEAPGAAIQPGRATWIARGGKGEQLTVSSM